MTPRLPASAALIFALATSSFGAGEAAIKPDQAGRDFAVQGEYVADNTGAQVIALGDGKFHIVAL